MNGEPVSPLCATVVRLNEFEQMSAVFAGWQGQIEQISAGRFEGTIQIVAGGALRAVTAEGTQRLNVRGRDASGLLAIYPLSARMARCTWNRNSLNPGQIFVAGTEDQMDISSERRFSGQVVFLQPAALEAAARSLRNTDGLTLPRDSMVRSPSPDAFAVVERDLNRLFSMCLADPTLLGTPEGHQLEQDCISALVTTLFPPTGAEWSLSPSARSKLQNRAEEYLRSRLGDHVGMIDLCQEIGANDRTLQLAFQDRYGVGPMTYFRFLRLNAARSKLRRDREVTIAAAAREFGFHHLGNFAADYRHLFGMLPSETERS